MKKLIIYYTSIIIPLVFLAYTVRVHFIDSVWFTISLFVYAFIYRTFTDYFRLRSKNVIDRKHFWKILVPGARIKYFKELYLA
jgi:hypothetical protein